jgi:hypothetical protein
VTMLAVGAICSAWLIGVLGVIALWPRIWFECRYLPLILSLGFGLGLAGTSAIYFFATVISETPFRVSAALDLLMAAAFAACAWPRLRRRPAPAVEPVEQATWIRWVSASAFAQSALMAAVLGARAYAAEPFGRWDGWAIWNMHARFLYFGRAGLNGLLRSPQIAWSHPDYPWLIPASIARAWTYSGLDAPFVAGLISVLFAAATVALLVGAIARLRSLTLGYVAGILLLGTPFFLTFSAGEYADIPMGFFVLAACAAIALGEVDAKSRGLPALAGFAVGAAAWTKNEGLLFAVIAALCCGVAGFRRGSGRWLAAFSCGMFFALIPAMYFKLALAPPNDVVSVSIAGRLGQVMDWTRYRLILAALWRYGARFGDWAISPFIAMALALIASAPLRLGRREKVVGALVALTLSGYLCVYLITPRDLAWQLKFSLDRLLLQLWPSLVFIWALCLNPNGAPRYFATPLRPAWRRGAICLLIAANLGATLLLARGLSRQLAVDELVRGNLSGADIHIGTGAGWYAPESDGRETWEWSKGKSELWMLVSDAKPVTMGLNFRMRGLGSRIVTARIGERLLWSRRIGEAFASVELPGLTLQPGLNTITFTSDSHGIAESAQPDARALTFALYQIRMK